MRRNLSILKIQSEFFSPSVELCLFEKRKVNDDDTKKISLIYGQNGSGKTTISKAFSNLKTQDQSDISAILLDSSSKPINLSETEKAEIFVFNDDFMENKVRFRSEDKMGVIVMLGEQVEIDNQINEVKVNVEKINSEINKLKMEEFNDVKSVKSSQYHFRKIRERLAETWAERDKELEQKGRRPNVTDSLIQEVIADKNIYDYKVENAKYNELKKQYEKIRDLNFQPIYIDLSNNKELVINIEAIRLVLNQVVQKPIETDLSNKIKYAFEKYNLERVKEIDKFFKEKQVDFCPYCFRDYTKNDADNIIKEISNLINQEFNMLISRIDKLKIQELEIVDLNSYEVLSANLIRDYNKSANKIKVEIERLNTLLEMKKSNPYKRIEFESDIETLYADFIATISLIEKEIENLNKSIEEKSSIFQQLKEQNKRLAFADCYTHKQSFITSKNEYLRAKSSYDKLNKELETCNSQISNLEAKKLRAELAFNQINKWLSLIFLDSNRIKLVFEDNKYAVKSRGKSIKLKNLSNGERNAVGLAYFFACINEKRSGTTFSDIPKLIVLDDPLSSFDYENKVGIYSFLKQIFLDVVKNCNSKILILTHQLDTMFSIKQMLEGDSSLKESKVENILVNKTLIKFKNNGNIYHRLLKEVGAFLLDDFSGDISSIPNKTRRILESFSTFNFGCGIAQLSTEDTITINIKDPTVRNYLRNSMHRLTLNNESHLEDNTKGLEEGMLMYFDNPITLNSVVKDVLLLIMELNESHFLRVFNDNQNVIEKIRNHRQYVIDTF